MNAEMEARQARANLIAGIRRALDKVRNHKDHTRLANAIRAEIGDGVCVHVDKSKYRGDSIKVWGCGIPFDHSVWLSPREYDYNRPDRPAMSWPDAIECGLQRADDSDHYERLDAERELYAKFSDMAAQIDALRNAAKMMVFGLPIPPSATIRKEPHFWHDARPETRKEFPQLFNEFTP